MSFLGITTPILPQVDTVASLNISRPITTVRCLCSSNDANMSGSSGSGGSPNQTSYEPSYNYASSSSARMRSRSVESRLRLQEYRRQAAQQQRQMALEEERRTFQLDRAKMYSKGHPGTVQAVVKEILDFGYILALPDGRDGLLTCMHLGCSGDVELLSRLMKVGDEVTVRVIKVPFPHGKDRCYVRDINSLAMP